MNYEGKYKEMLELSKSDNPRIKELADGWLIGIGLQKSAELRVSAFLLDLAIRNVKSEITSDEVRQMIEAHYADMPKTERPLGLDGGYEIISPDSPKNN